MILLKESEYTTHGTGISAAFSTKARAVRILGSQNTHVRQCVLFARGSWQRDVICLAIKRCVGIPLVNANCVFTCNCKCCLIKAGAFVLRILCVGVVGVC